MGDARALGQQRSELAATEDEERHLGQRDECAARVVAGKDGASAVHVQLTHRLLAFLLLLHLIGVVIGLARRRDESRTVARAATIALGLVILQFTVAASMVLLHLPAVLRSLHEAVGVSVWLGTFTYAYLARIAAGRAAAFHTVPLGDVPSRRSVGGEAVPVAGGSR